MRIDEWPSARLTTDGGTPAEIQREAMVWRHTCGWMGMPVSRAKRAKSVLIAAVDRGRYAWRSTPRALGIRKRAWVLAAAGTTRAGQGGGPGGGGGRSPVRPGGGPGFWRGRAVLAPFRLLNPEDPLAGAVGEVDLLNAGQGDALHLGDAQPGVEEEPEEEPVTVAPGRLVDGSVLGLGQRPRLDVLPPDLGRVDIAGVGVGLVAVAPAPAQEVAQHPQTPADTALEGEAGLDQFAAEGFEFVRGDVADLPDGVVRAPGNDPRIAQVGLVELEGPPGPSLPLLVAKEVDDGVLPGDVPAGGRRQDGAPGAHALTGDRLPAGATPAGWGLGHRRL